MGDHSEEILEQKPGSSKEFVEKSFVESKGGQILTLFIKNIVVS